MELRTANVRLEEIKELVSRVEFDENEDFLFDIPNNWVKEWTTGEEYMPGRLILRKGIKYLVLKRITASEYVYPETITARNIYEPFQGLLEIYNWAYGEKIKKGMQRIYENITYLAINNINKDDNITTPNLDSKNWEKVQIEEAI